MDLQKNLFGGITAAIIALPLGLAFGVASGLGATAGIYGAIILGFFASLFGGTDTQISGPTGPMTVIIASAVITLNHNINLIMTTILLAGLFQILFGFFKIGKFVQYIPYPVISGFMSGIGIIIIILQINPYLGVASDTSIIHILERLPSNISLINYDSFLVATLTLLIMFFTPKKISKLIPAPLLALIFITPSSVYIGLDVQTIGNIPSTLPSFIMPSFVLSDYLIVFTLAFTLAILGTIDTLLTSIVADSLTSTKHKPNKELIGQGIGNSICALFGAIPGAGATMRTVINIKSGGTSKISGMIHSLILLVIVLFLAPLASQIPMPLLAGILIKVGIDILDYRFFKIWNLCPKNDFIVMLVVFSTTVFIDLITAVIGGVILALLFIAPKIRKKTKITLINNKQSNIVQVDGVFFFGSSVDFNKKVNSIIDNKTVIIDIYTVNFIDITAIFALIDLVNKLKTKKTKIIFITKNDEKRQLLKLDKDRVFDNVVFNDNPYQYMKNN